MRRTVLLALLMLFARPAFAQMEQIYEDFGVGPRDMAMGNTGTASANNYVASFYNPAALVRARGLALDMGYKGVHPDLHMKIGRHGSKAFTDYPSTNLYLVGLSWNMELKGLLATDFMSRFTVALAAGFSDYFKSFTVYYDPDTPYFYRYHDRYLNLIPIYFGASFRLFEWLSIGGGLVPAPADTKVDVSVETNIGAPEYEFAATQSTVTRAKGKLEPLAGILVRVPLDGEPDRLSFGLVWRDQVSTADGLGEARNYTTVFFNGDVIKLPNSTTPILTLTGWSPMQIAGGIAWRPLSNATLTGDLLWKQWSKWKNFFLEHPDPRFRDTWNARFGGEYVFEFDRDVLKSIAARAGAYRENSPVPDQNGESNYLDPDKWVFSAGGGVDLKDPWEIFPQPVKFAIAGQWHKMDRIHLSNDRDPDFPALDAWGDVYSVSATVGISSR
ncbi:outer membrane protein transport protein [bacterium]|nr:outer membrane protein transport protein [bacterium]